MGREKRPWLTCINIFQDEIREANLGLAAFHKQMKEYWVLGGPLARFESPTAKFLTLLLCGYQKRLALRDAAFVEYAKILRKKERARIRPDSISYQQVPSDSHPHASTETCTTNASWVIQARIAA